MATDIKLDDGNGNQVTVVADVLRVESADLMLDYAARRQKPGRFRRALVHDQGDGLTVNFNNDYPGGVTLNGVTVVIPKGAEGVALSRKLPTLVVKGGIQFEMQGMSV